MKPVGAGLAPALMTGAGARPAPTSAKLTLDGEVLATETVQIIGNEIYQERRY